MIIKTSIKLKWCRSKKLFNIINNRHVVIIFIISIFSIEKIYSQTSTTTDNSMRYNNSAVPSSGVNTGISQGSNLNVDLYTGRLQCSLPIFTLSSSDLQIPISIDYTAGAGVKVQELNTPVGLGWSLNAGGSISRVVRGSNRLLYKTAFKNEINPNFIHFLFYGN